MSQLPTYFGPRTAVVPARNAHALALWRARDGLLSPATDSTPVTAGFGSLGISQRYAKDSLGGLYRIPQYMPNVECWDLDGDGICESPALRVTTAGHGNWCAYSEDFTNWTAVNTPAILAPTLTLGEVMLSLLSDTSGTLQSYYERTPSAIGLTGCRGVLSFLVAKGNINAAGGSGVILYDNTAAANRIASTWTWTTSSAGIQTPNVTVTTGQILSKEYMGRRTYLHQTTKLLQTVDVWRIQIRSTTGYVDANSHRIRVLPANTAAQQGNEFFGAVQLSALPGPYFKTTASTGGAEIDRWSMAFNPTPQALTLAVRFVYTGTTYCLPSAAATGLVCAITNDAGAAPYLWLMQGDGAGTVGYRVQVHDGTNTLGVNNTTQPQPGDVVLLRAVLLADSSLKLGVSLNGGTEVVATSGNPYGLPTAWVTSAALRLTEGATYGGEAYLGIGVFAGEPSAAYIEDVLS